MTDTGLMDEIKKFAKKMGSIGITVWVGSYVFVTCLNYAAERQVDFHNFIGNCWN